MCVSGRQEPPGGKNRAAVQKNCGPAWGKPRSEEAFKGDSLGLCELRSGEGLRKWSNFSYFMDGESRFGFLH